MAYSALSQNVAPSSTARSRTLNRSSSLGMVPYANDIPMRPKPSAGTLGPSFPSLRSGTGVGDISI